MIKIALIIFALNFSTSASFDYSFKCQNSMAHDQGMILELDSLGDAVLTYKDKSETKKVYLSSLSKNLSKVTFKTDTGSLLTAHMKNGNLTIRNLSETLSVGYSSAVCVPL